MKRLMVSIVITGIAGFAGPARACPELSFSLVSDEDPPKPVSTPIVILGAGASTDGWAGSAALGWAWGDRDVGWLFRTTKLRRVLIHVHQPFEPEHGDPDTVMRSAGDDGSSATTSATRFAVTYGWFETSKQLIDGGFDFGLSTTTRGELAPIAQLTLGVRGLGVRLTGGVDAVHTRFFGSAELVLDVATMAGRFW